MMTQLVSACMITYNHGVFIKEAIEGVLMQETSFPIECIIGEDYSIDNTRLICEKYEKKYSNIIKLLSSEKNLGAMSNLIRTLKACQGKYIALCEGDDYWTDPCKLQKQVDFLDNNPDYSLCGHSALQIFEEEERPNQIYKPKNLKDFYTIEDLIFASSIPTASFMIRRKIIDNLPLWLYNVRQGDYALLLLSAAKGKVRFIDETMSVYRKHAQSESGFIKERFLLFVEYSMKLLRYFDSYTEFKYHKLIIKRIREKKKQIFVYRIKKMMRAIYRVIIPRAYINKSL